MAVPTGAGADNQYAIDVHTQQADEFARRYEAQTSDPYADCFNYSRHRLASVIDQYLPKNGGGRALLDVGCGTGHHLRALKAAGYVIAGVDGSERMLEYARANNPGARIERADVDSLPFPPASFDYVLSIEVLRYLRNPQPSINEIIRVLRPGGVALVTAAPILNLNGYWLLNQIFSRLRIGSFTYLRQYFTTSHRLRRQFREAGFAEVTVHGVYIGPINWVGRLAKPLLRRFLWGWEAIDRAIADRPVVRNFANMYLIRAVRVE
jgi:ubiquinone/menaquinone biosynthesis C-methylase UbiE